MERDRIDVAAVQRLLGEGKPVAFVDVRSEEEWAESDEKLPAAIRATADDLSPVTRRVPVDWTVVPYCT